jgi:hypothetical protein
VNSERRPQLSSTTWYQVLLALGKCSGDDELIIKEFIGQYPRAENAPTDSPPTRWPVSPTS